jgi:glycine oxidase
MQCGYLDTVALLDHLRGFFLDQACFINTQIDLDELRIDSEFIEWHGHTAKKVIFCDGYHLQHNQWFSWLPLQPVQGEILTLKTNSSMPNEIIQVGNGNPLMKSLTTRPQLNCLGLAVSISLN